MLSDKPLLIYALSLGPLSHNPGRTVLAALGIALGVTLGVAVHLVNSTALSEFRQAVTALAGEADIVVRGPRAGLDEALYPRLARLPEIAAASPMLDIDVTLAGRETTLRLLGIDIFRASQLQPALLADLDESVLELLQADTVVLSNTAARDLGLGRGNRLKVQVGTRVLDLEVVAVLPPHAYRQRLAVMDIGWAQSLLARIGTLNRIDVRLRPGVDAERFRAKLASLLPAGVHAVTPEIESERGALWTRAYRTNLDMLAGVALFTGFFLVFATQFLALMRRRAQLALLRVLGMTRRALAVHLVAEGAVLGAVGSAAGVALGWLAAALTLRHFGGDLGAGYFRGVEAQLVPPGSALAAYFLGGMAVAMLGAAAPAIEAARRAPALALRAGDEEAALKRVRLAWPGLALAALGAACAFAPPLDGLPAFGYAAIALILAGAVLLAPRLVEFSLALVPVARAVAAALAVAQLRATARLVAVSAAAIVVSFSFTVAMAIMVGSFRTSFEEWLERILPADFYVRAARGGETGFFTPEEQARIAAIPGVARAAFLRSQNALLAPDRPPVVLLARDIDRAAPARTLPLIGAPHALANGDPPPVWVSEIAADLYGLKPGQRLDVPLAGALHAFTVAGIWRDYARQTGALVIERGVYARLTGDRLVSDAALWLDKRATLEAAAQALRARFAGVDLDIAAVHEVRETSLRIFDRTFAVTYVLEVVAILIGLFGVSVGFGAQALARRREFGVLRHLGMTRREIAAMLAIEGSVVSGLGVAFGLALGWGVSLVLIHVVNRQSFHWSIDLSMPWLALAALAFATMIAASATAMWSGRAAMGTDVVHAVKEDW